MVGIACSQFILVLLVLTVRPVFPWGADNLCMEGDSHSLHYDFNISFNEQLRCMVQGQKDGKKFLLYDCGSNKVIFMNLLRDEGKATDYCKVMLSTLNDVHNHIKPLLSDIKQEKYPDGAPFTTQVRMTCPCKAGGSTSGSLEFSLGGQRFLTFHSEREEYRADNSLGERLKKKWENNVDLNTFLRYNLNGDCKEMLKCLVPWKKELETTAAPITVPAPATTTPTIASASPITVPAPATTTPTIASASPITVPAPATTTPTIASASPAKTTHRLEAWAIILIISVIVTILIIICIIRYCYRKRSQKMLKCCWECGLVQKVSQLFGCLSTSSCSPVDLQELPSLQQMQRLAEGGEDTADAMFVSCSP